MLPSLLVAVPGQGGRPPEPLVGGQVKADAALHDGHVVSVHLLSDDFLEGMQQAALVGTELLHLAQDLGVGGLLLALEKGEAVVGDSVVG